MACSLLSSWHREQLVVDSLFQRFRFSVQLIHKTCYLTLSCTTSYNCVIMHLQTPWPESARKVYRPSDRRFSAKLVTAFTDRVCHVISVTDLCGRILGFLDRRSYFFFRAAPQFYSRGWVDPVPDPLLLIKCSSAGNRTRTSGSVARNSDH
jgi:hypothetical protein